MEKRGKNELTCNTYDVEHFSDFVVVMDLNFNMFSWNSRFYTWNILYFILHFCFRQWLELCKNLEVNFAQYYVSMYNKDIVL